MIGADILYEPSVHSCLIDVAARTVKPDGCLLVADPGRAPAEAFVARMEAAGWIWTFDEVTLPGEAKPVNILLFRRAAP